VGVSCVQGVEHVCDTAELGRLTYLTVRMHQTRYIPADNRLHNHRHENKPHGTELKTSWHWTLNLTALNLKPHGTELKTSRHWTSNLTTLNSKPHGTELKSSRHRTWNFTALNFKTHGNVL